MLIPTIGGNVGQPFYIGYCITSFEWNDGTAASIPGASGVNYLNQPNSIIDEVAQRKMNMIRLSFLHERVQPTLNGPFSGGPDNYWQRLQDFVKYANSKNITVTLCPHNFAEYFRTDLGANYIIGSAEFPTSAFADFWGKMAQTFKNNSKLVFNLTNEPKFNITATNLVTAWNTVIAAIRSNGFLGKIHAPGISYASADGFISNGNDTAFLNLVDPCNNTTIELHNYGNADHSGADVNIPTATAFKDSLSPVVAWARANKKKLYIGETAFNSSGTNATVAFTDQLDYIHRNKDVFEGYNIWAGGIFLANFTLTPDYSCWSGTNVDTDRLTPLKKYLGI